MPKEQAMVLVRQVWLLLGLVGLLVELLAKQLALVMVMLEQVELLYLELELGEPMVLEGQLGLLEVLELNQVKDYHLPYLEVKEHPLS